MDKTAPSTRHTSEQVRRSLTVFHVRCRKNCANPPGQSIRSATSTTKITRKAISIESRPVAHAEQHQAATAASPFPCTRPTDHSARTQCESQCGRHGGCPQRQGDGVEHDHHRNRRFEGPMLCHTLVSSPRSARSHSGSSHAWHKASKCVCFGRRASHKSRHTLQNRDIRLGISCTDSARLKRRESHSRRCGNILHIAIHRHRQTDRHRQIRNVSSARLVLAHVRSERVLCDLFARQRKMNRDDGQENVQRDECDQHKRNEVQRGGHVTRLHQRSAHEAPPARPQAVPPV